MFGNTKVNHTPALMRQDHQYEQNSKGSTGHREEINRDQLTDVIIQKGFPGL
jgi:hypothetical protein